MNRNVRTVANITNYTRCILTRVQLERTYVMSFLNVFLTLLHNYITLLYFHTNFPMHIFADYIFSNSLYMFLLLLCIHQSDRQNFLNNDLSVLISATTKKVAKIVNINLQQITIAI